MLVRMLRRSKERRNNLPDMRLGKGDTAHDHGEAEQERSASRHSPATRPWGNKQSSVCLPQGQSFGEKGPVPKLQRVMYRR
jgi:hypothetical protein